MEILVTYDVATDTRAGERRLRRVAKVCEAYGQRVQKSVFECSLSSGHLAILQARLWREINPHRDSLRFYRLREPLTKHRALMGVQPIFDLHDTVVI